MDTILPVANEYQTKGKDLAKLLVPEPRAFSFAVFFELPYLLGSSCLEEDAP